MSPEAEEENTSPLMLCSEGCTVRGHCPHPGGQALGGWAAGLSGCAPGLETVTATTFQQQLRSPVPYGPLVGRIRSTCSASGVESKRLRATAIITTAPGDPGNWQWGPP